MTLPPDLAALVSSLTAVDNAVAALATTLTDGQFNWQPLGGRAWSIGQCLDHLRASSAVYLPALDRAAEEARSRGLRRREPLRPGGLPSKWFISMIGPQPRVRMKAPSKIAPASRLDRDAAIAAFLDTQARVRDYVTRNADLDLNAVRFNNPLVKGLRFTVATGLLIIEAHNRRHLWQAQQVARTVGFPSS
jgi:hypothetical protein